VCSSGSAPVPDEENAAAPADRPTSTGRGAKQARTAATSLNRRSMSPKPVAAASASASVERRASRSSTASTASPEKTEKTAKRRPASLDKVEEDGVPPPPTSASVSVARTKGKAAAPKIKPSAQSKGKDRGKDKSSVEPTSTRAATREADVDSESDLELDSVSCVEVAEAGTAKGLLNTHQQGLARGQVKWGAVRCISLSGFEGEKRALLGDILLSLVSGVGAGGSSKGGKQGVQLTADDDVSIKSLMGCTHVVAATEDER
jgi:hypothetical protein